VSWFFQQLFPKHSHLLRKRSKTNRTVYGWMKDVIIFLHYQMAITPNPTSSRYFSPSSSHMWHSIP